MGVPKFFRWISERYPKINQPLQCPPNPDTRSRYFVGDTSEPVDNQTNQHGNGTFDSSSTQTPSGGGEDGHDNDRRSRPHRVDPTIPEFDRLYIDLNGVIHGCSHNNSNQKQDGTNPTSTSVENESEQAPPLAAVEELTEEQIFAHISYYLDRMVTDVVRPKEVLYIAIDGVAPRAKMNQQRSRRFRAGKEKEISEIQARERRRNDLGFDFDGNNNENGYNEYNNEQMEFDHHDRESTDTVAMNPSGNFSGRIHTGTGTKKTESVSIPLEEKALGKFLDVDDDDNNDSHVEVVDHDEEEPGGFHLNSITPGTPFLDRCATHIEQFLRDKKSNDPAWSHLRIIFSGPNVPGEGEHKIMDFIREEKQKEKENSRSQSQQQQREIRHCLMGQDGDLIMLGLVTHEVNFCLLRERVIFPNITKDVKFDDGSDVAESVKQYTDNNRFELLHLNVLRDYLAFEFGTKDVQPHSSYDLERTVDDWVFLTFFVGNDFLPHMPAMDIFYGSFDVIFSAYRRNRTLWRRMEGPEGYPYLTKDGTIYSGRRLAQLFRTLGQHEEHDNEYKRVQMENRFNKLDAGEKTFPNEMSREEQEKDENEKRKRYQEMLERIVVDLPDGGRGDGTSSSSPLPVLRPVLSSRVIPQIQWVQSMKEDHDEEEEEESEPGLFSRMASTILESLSPKKQPSRLHSTNNNNNGDNDSMDSTVGPFRFQDVTDLKGRYYFDKFGFSPLDLEEHRRLRTSYLEGLLWNLQYYYHGCPSWSWYYPYHYGPMLSDLGDETFAVPDDKEDFDMSYNDNPINDWKKTSNKGNGNGDKDSDDNGDRWHWDVGEVLDTINFKDDDGDGGSHRGPLEPFQQLLACMPPNNVEVLPQPYRFLMIDAERSPIIDFYPHDFEVDMNGKRFPWEAVVLLPFIDADRLVEAVNTLVDTSLLTDEERRMNGVAEVVELPGTSNTTTTTATTTTTTAITTTMTVDDDARSAIERLQPGFATLRTVPVNRILYNFAKVNVFGARSRYRTCLLSTGDKDGFDYAIFPTAELLGPKLVHSTVWINYPYFREAYVVGVSDAHGIYELLEEDSSGIKIESRSESRSLYRPWKNDKEISSWKDRLNRLGKEFKSGDGTVGSGGWLLPSVALVASSEKMSATGTAAAAATGSTTTNGASSSVYNDNGERLLLTVRPIQGVDFLEDHNSNGNYHGVKIFEPPENAIELPFFACLWSPHTVDPRYADLPSRVRYHLDEHVNEKEGYKTLEVKDSVPVPPPTVSLNSKSKPPFQRITPPSSNNKNTTKVVLPPLRESVVDPLTVPFVMEKGTSSSTSQPTETTATTANTTKMTPKASVTSSLQDMASSWASFGWRKMTTMTSLPLTTSTSTNPSQWRSTSTTVRRVSLPMRMKRAPGRGGIAVATLLLSAFTRGRAMGVDNVDLGLMGGGSFNRPTLSPWLTSSHNSNNDDDHSRNDDNDGNHNGYMNVDVPPLEFLHGTTTVSFVYGGGIVAAVDSRASMGNFVGSKTVQKVIPVNRHILATMAGGAADCSYWIRKLRSYAQVCGQQRPMTVTRASRLLSDFLYQNRGMGLSVGTMVLGHDSTRSTSNHSNGNGGGFNIYYVDDSGLRIQGDLFAVGSGSTYALGILDTVSREQRYAMTDDEAVALGVRAIRHATFRDAHSGGYIGVYLIKHKHKSTRKKGQGQGDSVTTPSIVSWTKVFSEDVAARGITSSPTTRNMETISNEQDIDKSHGPTTTEEL